MIEILHPVADRARIDAVLDAGHHLVDGWSTALDELTALCALAGDPGAFDPHDLDASSRYVVYPWRRRVVRLPDAGLFLRLRTTRNRYLITDEEQDRWSSSTIAVAGLSVGGSVLHTCALTGARRFVITDPDTLGPSNLNRLSGSVCDLGEPKAVLAARRILELDPYSEITVVEGGYRPDGEFLAGGPDVVLEEMDDLRRKLELRVEARRRGIPVVMVTDDGDGVMVDVERFDLEPDRPLLHGRVEALLAAGPESLDDPARRVEIAGAIVGDDVADRMRYSLGQVGRTIGSWPQLGTAATLAGAVGAALARRIVIGDDVPSGRAHVRLEDLALR
ncbi:MAG: ThiF family adenylyltransferase [Gordonia sp. (in: high G+C Gram-positive bacteria)]|uniref:ThiF family adenylyltransferase n=1 Tax=Gordonia sp. (in: high G+C Gram-positive bacteria) TaxID=84139 RepID=UPI0039E6D1BD